MLENRNVGADSKSTGPERPGGRTILGREGNPLADHMGGRSVMRRNGWGTTLAGVVLSLVGTWCLSPLSPLALYLVIFGTDLSFAPIPNWGIWMMAAVGTVILTTGIWVIRGPTTRHQIR